MEASCYCPTIRAISQSQANNLLSLSLPNPNAKKTYWSATAAYDPVCRVLADRKPFPRKRGFTEGLFKVSKALLTKDRQEKNSPQ